MMSDALISREIVAGKDGCAMIKEIWNIAHPDCPFVVMKLGSYGVDEPSARSAISPDHGRG